MSKGQRVKVDGEYTYVIVGAGPAGLQLSYYLQQHGADYVTLERALGAGEFFRRFPRHRRLISLNKVHTDSTDPEIRLRWDWNSLLNDCPDLLFPRFSDEYLPAADDLVRYLGEFQKVHGLNVRYGTTVQRISRVDDGFLLRTDQGTVRARCLVVATGWTLPFVPAIKGIEHAIGYEDMDVDPETYAGQRVLILGKGNSAFETASSILGKASMVHLASRHPLRLAWNTKHPGDVRGQYGAILDSYQFKTLHSVLDCRIDEIRPVDGRYQVSITYSHADGETAELDYHTVLRCTGFRMDTSMFDDGCRPDMIRDDRMPGLRPDWQSSNIDGLYFAGTIAQARDVKHASSPFIDGFRYNLRTFTRILRERYEGVPLPFTKAPGHSTALAALMLDRVNWSSALWTQFEYLCDVFVRDPATGDFLHYEDLPEDYAIERFAHARQWYTLALRWGRDDYGDVFAIERHPTPDRAGESAFIHPVVRHYEGARCRDEKHLLEDLLAQWRRPDRHVQPLINFLAETLNSAP
ncbi:NAD(P)-binding domain-containing protein [Micromonospora sediminicola]|uniref:NAD(P)-binding domain-containing protein n=1 Tax=Micromonospora sediminicola TaxID=946078 RepID=UPI0033DDF376